MGECSKAADAFKLAGRGETSLKLVREQQVRELGATVLVDGVGRVVDACREFFG